MENIEVLLVIILIILFGIMWILAIIGNHLPAKKRTVTYKTFPTTHIRKPVNERWACNFTPPIDYDDRGRLGIILHTQDVMKIEEVKPKTIFERYRELNEELHAQKNENLHNQALIKSLQSHLSDSEEECRQLGLYKKRSYLNWYRDVGCKL